MYSKRKNGFTLLEVLMVIGILAILAGVVLVAVNPARQFKVARDSQRKANIQAILSSIGQNMTDHTGNFVCEGVVTQIPTTVTRIASDTAFDLAPCVVPDYISSLPYDPSLEGAFYEDETNYDTGYLIVADSNGRITISSQSEVTGQVLSVTR
ncbi:MAG: type II secretion system protein [Candidatus Taylorbacteria bacterium]|nr:type II secretion system protein [Candidatus Taylorbacteria bacterium]